MKYTQSIDWKTFYAELDRVKREMASERVDAIVVSGTHAELRLSTFGNEPVELWRASSDAPAVVERFDLPNPPHIQQPLVQSIVDELRGRGEDQEDLVAAIEAGADGLQPMTTSERDPARSPTGGVGRPARGGREIVLGAR